MAVQKILSRWSQALLFECEAESTKEALVKAVASGANLYGANLYRADLSGANLYRADLSGADLSGANLYRADLSGADLSGADLSGAKISRANLSGADLYGADLSGADLSGADLSGAKIEWSSHSVVAEILRQAAGDEIEKLKVAGLILIQRSWCWNEFMRTEDPLKDWAIDTLAPFVQEGDGARGELLRKAKALAAAKATADESDLAPVATEDLPL